MSTIEEYVGAVIKHIPPCLPERSRIASDLRSHLSDLVDAGETAGEAIARMGAAGEVAREFLSGISLRPASVLRRTAAFALDIGLGVIILVLVVMFVSGPASWSSLGELSPKEALLAVIILLAASDFYMAVLYFPIIEMLLGQTLGKRAFGLCVVREDGTRTTLFPAIVRRIAFFPFISVGLFVFDVAFAVFTQRRQRAFDLIARTMVVEKDRD